MVYGSLQRLHLRAFVIILCYVMMIHIRTRMEQASVTEDKQRSYPRPGMRGRGPGGQIPSLQNYHSLLSQTIDAERTPCRLQETR